MLTAGLGVATAGRRAAVLDSNEVSSARVRLRIGYYKVLSSGPAVPEALIAFIWTLFWLIKADRTRAGVLAYAAGVWRFSGNAVRASVSDLKQHLASSSEVEDAWQQVLDLSGLRIESLPLVRKRFTVSAHSSSSDSLP